MARMAQKTCAVEFSSFWLIVRPGQRQIQSSAESISLTFHAGLTYLLVDITVHAATLLLQAQNCLIFPCALASFCSTCTVGA